MIGAKGQQPEATRSTGFPLMCGGECADEPSSCVTATEAARPNGFPYSNVVNSITNMAPASAGAIESNSNYFL